MTYRRAKAAAAATVLGLGGLGAVALGTNPGMPATAQQVSAGGSGAIVTSASGAAAAPTSATVAVRRKSSPATPIVTRASGGGLGIVTEDS